MTTYFPESLYTVTNPPTPNSPRGGLTSPANDVLQLMTEVAAIEAFLGVGGANIFLATASLALVGGSTPLEYNWYGSAVRPAPTNPPVWLYPKISVQLPGDTVARLTIYDNGAIQTSQDGTTAALNTGFYNFRIPSQGGINGSAGFLIQASADGDTNSPLQVIDHLGAPIWWVANAGGTYITDNMSLVNGVFGSGSPPYQMTRNGVIGRGAYTYLYNLATPVPTIALASGGSLPTGQVQYYKVTATRLDGTETVGGAATPTNLTPTGTNLSVQINWSSIAGACNYRIYRSTSSTFGATCLIGTVSAANVVNSTSFTDTGITATTGTPPANPTGNSQIFIQRWASTNGATVQALELQSEFGTQVAAWYYDGHIAAPIVPTTVTADPNPAGVYNYYRCNYASSGNITLPSSGLSAGNFIRIKQIANNTLTIVGTVDGVTNPTLSQYGHVMLVYNGSTWDSL